MKSMKKLFALLLIISQLSFTPIQAQAWGWDNVKGVLDDIADAALVVGVGLALGPATFGVGLVGVALGVGGILNDGDFLGMELSPEQQAEANACLSKSVETLRTELKAKYEELHIDFNEAEVDSETDKNKLCASILNAEAEDQSPSESFLWKPISESDSKAVTLLPTSLRGLVVRTDVFEKETGAKLDSGRFSGDEHNGMRPHYRFPKPGASYGGPIQVIASVAEGIWIWDIKDAAKRTEGIKGKFSTWAEVAAWEAAQKQKEELAKLGDVGSLFGDGSFCPAHASAQDKKNLRILLLGDSNTAGTGNPAGTSAPNSVGYRAALKTKLVAQGYTVDFVGSQCSGSSIMSDCQHEGYPGKGIAQIQSRIDAGVINQYDPNVIVLLVGSNDMWVSLDNRVPISDTQAQNMVAKLKTLVDDITEQAPKAAIMIAKPATPSTATRPLGIYRNGIDTIATNNKAVEIIDLSSAANDGVHYTPTGFEKIASLITDKIIEGTRECQQVLEKIEKIFTEDQIKNKNGGALKVECSVGDDEVAIDEDVSVRANISGGTSPYSIKWTSNKSKDTNNLDKEARNQNISFDKIGSYKLQIKVTDDKGDKVTESCPTIKVTEDGEDDVIVTVNEPAPQVTNNASLASAFYRDLTVGSTGPDVTALQQFLVARGYLIMPAGTSYGYFGELTRKGLANFQAASGITPAAGYFGARTRAFITGGSVPINPLQTTTSNVSPSQIQQYNQSISATTPTSSCIDITSPIYYGEENPNVTKVQQFLVAQGHLAMPAGSTYGYYGKATVTALSKFMTARGYVHNGAIMDSKVLGELKAASCR